MEGEAVPNGSPAGSQSRGRGVIHDPKAEEIIDGLDYDISLAYKDAAMHNGVIACTVVLDRLVSDWLAKNPAAVVITIACGLDTRCYRMHGYAHRYNLNLPQTAAVREWLLPKSGSIFQITMSATENWVHFKYVRGSFGLSPSNAVEKG